MFVLATIQPLDSATGARTLLRVCSSHNLSQTGYDGQTWLPAIVSPGALETELFDGDFTSPINPAQNGMTLSEKVLRDLAPATLGLRWQDAPVSVWASEDPAAPVLRFVGKVTRFERGEGLIKITANVRDEAGETDVLGLTYAGTTGIEGPADLKGRVKPWLLGTCRNVEGVNINVADNVWQFSAYGPIKAVLGLYERGASFGASIGDYASYAALVAADIPEGRWGTCLASGLIRLGAPPYGVITADIEGDYTGSVFAERTGAIIQRIASVRGIDSATIDASSMTALDSFAAALPAGGKIGIYISEQVKFLDLAQRLCLPLNAQAGYSLTGKLFACRVAIGSSTFNLDALGREMPVVSAMIEADTLPPYSTIVMGGERSWRVHDIANDVAFFATLVDRGDYAAGETYREGNIVRMPGGSTFVYINPAASSGNAPPNLTYWQQLTGEIEYPDGTPINDLRPAEPAADVTATAQIVVVPPPAQIVYRSFEGAPKAGQFTRTLTPVIKRGETDIRTDNSVTVAITPTAGISATVNTTNGSADKGRITVTDGGAGSIAMTVTVSGVDYGPYAIPFSVQDDLPPIDQGANGGSDSTLADVSTTGFTQMASTNAGETLFTVTTTSGQQIVGTAPLTYRWTRTGANGANKLKVKWGYRVAGSGGAYTDFVAGTAITGTDATWNNADFSGEAGSVTGNQSVTPGAGTWEVSLFGAKDTSLGNAITIETGTATVRVQS